MLSMSACALPIRSNGAFDLASSDSAFSARARSCSISLSRCLSRRSLLAGPRPACAPASAALAPLDDVRGVQALAAQDRPTPATVSGVVLDQSRSLVHGSEATSFRSISPGSHDAIATAGGHISRRHRHAARLASRPVQGKELSGGVSPQPDAQGIRAPVARIRSMMSAMSLDALGPGRCLPVHARSALRTVSRSSRGGDRVSD